MRWFQSAGGFPHTNTVKYWKCWSNPYYIYILYIYIHAKAVPYHEQSHFCLYKVVSLHVCVFFNINTVKYWKCCSNPYYIYIHAKAVPYHKQSHFCLYKVVSLHVCVFFNINTVKYWKCCSNPYYIYIHAKAVPYHKQSHFCRFMIGHCLGRIHEVMRCVGVQAAASSRWMISPSSPSSARPYQIPWLGSCALCFVWG